MPQKMTYLLQFITFKGFYIVKIKYTLWAQSIKRFQYILLKFVLHVANNKLADKFSNDGRLLWSVPLLRNKSFCHS